MGAEVGIIISIIGIMATFVGIILRYDELIILIQKLRTEKTYKISEKIKFWVIENAKKVGFIFIICGLFFTLFGLLIQLWFYYQNL